MPKEPGNHSVTQYGKGNKQAAFNGQRYLLAILLSLTHKYPNTLEAI